MRPVFRDRAHAGRVLAGLLAGYRRRDVLVLGLPRGGVPVAAEVALALDADLDVFLVRKLGVPGHEELAMGAVASGGVRVLHDEVVLGLGIPPAVVEQVTVAERQELARRERAYRGGDPALPLGGRTVVLVDDGLATGSTMRAAVAAARLQTPAAIVVAVPVAPAPTCANLRTEVDDVVCAVTPSTFRAVGQAYDDFSQTTDDEVRELLRRATESRGQQP